MKSIEERNNVLQKAKTLTKSAKRFKERKEEIKQVKFGALAKSKDDKARNEESLFEQEEKLTEFRIYRSQPTEVGRSP